MDSSVMAILNDALKRNRVVEKEKFNYSKVANSSIGIGYLNGEKIERVIIYLRGKGCDWSCKKNGGCLMCGHYYGTAQGEDLPKNSYYEQFQSELKKYDFTNIPTLCIYNAGSILNKNEVDTKELIKMLELTCRYSGIKRIVLESRPEFVEIEVLKRISEVCRDKVVEIGIGLETSSDIIREKCINKGFSFLNYIEAVCKIKKFSNIKVLTYLTVKPLFLTIEESVKDVTKSMFDIQPYTDIISLEPVSIQKNTVVDYLYELGMYSPPKGWMIKEIIESLRENNCINGIDLRLGGFEFFPIPDLVIGNCEKCNSMLYKAIDDYNANKNTALLEGIKCKCYDEYCRIKSEERKITEVSIDDRILNTIRKILLKVVA